MSIFLLNFSLLISGRCCIFCLSNTDFMAIIWTLARGTGTRVLSSGSAINGRTIEKEKERERAGEERQGLVFPQHHQHKSRIPGRNICRGFSIRYKFTPLGWGQLHSPDKILPALWCLGTRRRRDLDNLIKVKTRRLKNLMSAQIF